MRRDVAAQLECDRRVPAEPNRAQCSAPLDAVDVCPHRLPGHRSEADEPARRERLSPEVEEFAEGDPRSRSDFDDADGGSSPRRVRAGAFEHVGSDRSPWWRNCDSGWNDDDAPACEELQVHAETSRVAPIAAKRADAAPMGGTSGPHRSAWGRATAARPRKP